MKKIAVIIVLFALFTSCEKEIELDLKNSGSKIVVEGVISNDSSTQTIKISRSVAFYDPNDYPAVSGAAVQVSENGGTPITFTETSPGIYQATGFTGVPGRTYSLSMSIEGKTYTSSSTMPLEVPFTGITYEENVFTQPGGEKSYVVTPVFDDPAADENYYRFNLYINDVKDNKTIVTLNDVLINGETNTFGFTSYDDDNEINAGETVKIEMFGIDKNVYNYFYVLQQNSDSQNTPNNPESNITNGVLGYFSAQNKQVRMVEIQAN